MPGDFLLLKWYMDCVSEDGTAVIAYWADLRWRSLHLHYSSVLGDRGTLRATPEPIHDEARRSIRWDAPAMGVSARWEILDAPLSASLLEGAVQWRCIAPRARATVEVGETRVEGLGYVEHLTLTAAPWRLGLMELLWGRFLSDNDSIVWIHCEGEKSESLVFRNGERLADVPDLAYESTEVLRSGALGGTALSIIPNLHEVFPKGILSTEETKWLSRGTLDGSSGWAIHERVRWA